MTDENKDQKLSIGSELKAARIKAGLSIDGLQKKTKIQKKYLVDIENNDFDSLPGKFYVRAFVRQFANAVGLNGEQLIDSYNLTKSKPAEVKKNMEPVKNERSTSQSTPRPSRVVTPSVKDREKNLNKRKYLPLLGLLVILIVVVAVVWISISKTQKDSSSSAPTNSKVTVSNDDTKKKSNDNKSKKDSKSNDKTEITPVKGSTSDFTVKTGKTTSKLDLGASQKANTIVKINGNQVWQGDLDVNAGHTVDIPANTTDVNIHMTNAPVSSVKLNDKQITLPAQAQGQDAQQRDMNLKFTK
ncbi:hypothetical protein BGL34_00425 [Fructilactobacillus lindneri]|uniref:DUF4115 domain-containing protein n=2 Tax=Fructilactobacillus lindneri TaxID=53444 RepID=A0A0R2JPY9_9LACO|nr:helix-turn-helix domain-containing protein [Fructilactobacillus lindneri]ANZ58341.1 hypothetical protein AYR60_06155 [Fructilactobacillus lindneri]ANZ59663.1 hypothetical protein AYR59_06410 [Fructilactobacillus lindneri]KRN79176.1 hypothetical protein IV52_GL000582 [Fructilactobacillus lindneri DSM 20690 = JCM 11027]POG98553.1 hypothetical protein BGL31_01015 [Fructilactobacillus lindneri]POH03941.1 hypothetical protein BGL32_00955 [Fructilactobacillus lindneri]